MSQPAARALAADQSPQAVAVIRAVLLSPEEKKLSERFSLLGADSRETAEVKRACLAALQGRTDPASAALLTEIIALGQGKMLGAREGASSQWRSGEGVSGRGGLTDFPDLAMKMLGARSDPAARALMQKEAVSGGATWSARVLEPFYDAHFAQASGPVDPAVVEGAMKTLPGMRALARHLPGKGHRDLEAEIARRLAAG